MKRAHAAARAGLAALLLAASLAAPLSVRAGEGGPAAASFDAIPGWAEDDQAPAYLAFRRSCAPVLARARTSERALMPACRAAWRRPALANTDARAFFERHFRPVPLVEPGFLTGYFEPEYEGSLVPTARFTTPLLARPGQVVDRPAGTIPGLAGDLTAARRRHGGLAALPDRAGIEAGALGRSARPIVYLDPIEAFIVHVQGSARIRLTDGRVRRVAFAGRNGWPYTSIGRALSLQERIPPAEMGLKGLVAWLRAHPAEAPGVMRLNRSYIFFRVADDIPAGAGEQEGPVGSAGVPLTPGRSLAIDRHLWRYGLPVWLDGAVPGPDGAIGRLRRLVVAQDTGAAIVGPARGDLFVGTGAAAGEAAGRLRHAIRFVALRPIASPGPIRPARTP